LGDSRSSDDGDWGTGSNLDGAQDNVEQPLTGKRGGVVSDEQRVLSLEPGWFVVFPLELSSPCSLLVGKILSVDSGRGEVNVEWYTPARNRRCRRSMYGKGICSQQFVLEGGRRVADVGTESIDSACFTFPSLLQSGKLPAAVWAAVEECVPTTSLEEEDSENEWQDNEDEGGQGSGSPAHSHASGLPAPVTRPCAPPHDPLTPLPPNVGLTLAHYRPRRGGRQEK